MQTESFDVTARKFHQWGVVALSALAFVLDAAFDFCALCFVVHTARRATA